MQKLLLVTSMLFLLLSSGNSQSSSLALEEFSIEQIKEDINYWRTLLEKRHPLLYYYTPKDSLDQQFDKLLNSTNSPMTDLELFQLMAPIAAMIKDGHNTFLPGMATINKIADRDDLLPFEVHFNGKELFLKYNLSKNDSLTDGLIITHINEVKTEIITQQIISVLPRDGFNLQLPTSILNNQFRFYYHVFFGFSNTYKITGLQAGKSETLLVEGISLDSIRQIRKERYPKPNGREAISFQSIDSLHTALLTIKTFDKKALKSVFNQNFRKEIRQHFKSLNQSSVQNLIIDLRNNGGGNPDYVKLVLKHLFEEPFTQAETCRRTVNKHQEDFYLRTAKRWVPWYGIGSFRPANKPFTGNVYVLINEGTFSAAVELASVLKKYDRATFIGRETGGNPYIMAGYLIKTHWKLPNTGLVVGPGTICTIYDDLAKNTGRGIIPDHSIGHNPNGQSSTTDLFLAKALELIAIDQKEPK